MIHRNIVSGNVTSADIFTNIAIYNLVSGGVGSLSLKMYIQGQDNIQE